MESNATHTSAQAQDGSHNQCTVIFYSAVSEPVVLLQYCVVVLSGRAGVIISINVHESIDMCGPGHSDVCIFTDLQCITAAVLDVMLKNQHRPSKQIGLRSIRTRV